MTKNISDLTVTELGELEGHINNEVQLWNDIAKMDGTSIMVSPMYQYSDDLWTFLESMDLPQADDGKIGEYTEHLNEIHGVIVDEDFDLKALCPRCKELAIEIQMTIQGYVEQELNNLSAESSGAWGEDGSEQEIEQQIADIKRNNRLQEIDQELSALGDRITWDDTTIHKHNELQWEAEALREQNWKRSGDLAQIVPASPCPHCGSKNVESYPFPLGDIKGEPRGQVVELWHCNFCKGKDWSEEKPYVP